MTLPTIEDGVPLPPRQAAGKWADRLRSMRPRQSFLVQSARERTAIYMSAKRLGILIITRKVNASGFRVWRL